MTYLEFHLLFTLPPILLLVAWVRPLPSRVGRRPAWALPAVCAIAFVYTTPWDNYLVREGVWSYGEERVQVIIGFVPVEEYAFFVLQSVLAGLWFYGVLERAASFKRLPRWLPALCRSGTASRWAPVVRAGPAVFWAGAALAGLALSRTGPGGYLGQILVWACPVLAVQWAWAGDRLVCWWRPVLAGIAVPTLYLWAADAYALARGIWTISPDHSTGIALAGLPLEEAIFFLLTNALVVKGLVLFLSAPSRAGGRRPVGARC